MPSKSRRHRAHRHEPGRRVLATVFVLCEGHRTEPDYFTDMRKALRLTGVRVLPTFHQGLAGVARRLAAAIGEGIPEDEYWCVVDHDEREPEFRRFLSRVAELRSLKSRPRIRMTISKPCFEYWLLLHFEYTTREFRGSPGHSACAQVISRLKRHLPVYRKNDPRLFVRLREHLPEAIDRAKRGRAAGFSFTDVGELVERLGALADPVHSSGLGPVGR